MYWRFLGLELVIFDIQGRKVKTLLSEYMLSGSHLVTWDAKNNEGQDIPSGVYIYQLSSENQILSNKMTLLK